MAKYRVNLDGEIVILNGPPGATDAEVRAIAEKLYRPKAQPFHKDEKDYEGMGWDEVGTSAVMNLIPSTARMVSDIWDAVSSPIETATTLSQVIGGGVRKAISQIPGVDMTIPENEQKYNAVVDYFADKYGTVGGFKKALAEDPAGILADISATFTGGGTAVAKTLGTTTKAAQVAEKVAEVGAKIDPITTAITATGKIAKIEPIATTITATGKIAEKTAELGGKGVAQTLAFTSGVGDEAIKQAYKAGREGGEALDSFTKNLRNSDNATALQILEDAQTNVQAIKKSRQNAYKEGMAKVSKDQQKLSFDEVDGALADIRSRWETPQGIVKNDKVKSVYEDALGKVDEFKSAGANSLTDFDDLKQALNSLRSQYVGSPEATAAINEITTTISNQIKRSSPDYAKVMKTYEDTSKLLYEIQQTLSLGQKKSAEVSLKKLLSTMRNNVATNYGQRYSLVEALQDVGGKELMSGIAGQELATLKPRGLRGATTAGGIGFLGMSGMLSVGGAIPTLMASSPRLVGEFAKLSGSTARRTRGLLSKLPVSKAQALPPASGSYAAILGRDYEEEE